jgi:hypothetical protein
MGRTPDRRSIQAGKRFGEAVGIFFSSYEQLVKSDRWKKFVGYYELKKIRKWAAAGLPEKRVSGVAEFFGLEPSAFTDDFIPDKAFYNKLHALKPIVLSAGTEKIQLARIDIPPPAAAPSSVSHQAWFPAEHGPVNPDETLDGRLLDVLTALAVFRMKDQDRLLKKADCFIHRKNAEQKDEELYTRTIPSSLGKKARQQFEKCALMRVRGLPETQNIR